MPYRLRGKCVLVKRGGVWEKLKCHATRAKAKRHLAALVINVDH